MFKARFFVLFSFLTISSILAQKKDVYVNPEPKNTDYNYSDFIYSVKFTPEDSEIDYPIIELGGAQRLLLQFDDLEADNKNYFYKIYHCNADWSISQDIFPIDYIDGYQENRFYESTVSFNTRVDFTHYYLRIPNDDVKFKLSGNYLLKVYLNDDENDLVLTRRFVVFEPKMKAVPTVRRSAIPPYSRSHQELSLRVEHAGIYLPQPSQDVKVAILQNGRWDNMIYGIKPTFIQEEAVVYDFQGQIIFPGFKEFRPLDVRTIRHRGPQVETFEQTSNGFKLTLFPDIPRNLSAYLFTNDLNGKFIIASHDVPAANERGEYMSLKFSLISPKIKDKEMFLTGGFSDFQAYSKYQLSYNEEQQKYEGEFLFKNGFYDYSYAALEKGSEKIDEQLIEGSTFETENDYLFLVYYRKYGGRYDQVVAYTKTGSNRK